MRFFLFISLLFAVFSVAKTVPLSINIPTSVTLESGDFVQIDNFPSQWGYSRIVLGIQPQGGSSLEGFFSKDSCQYTLTGNYQQIDFEFDAEAVFLKYLGNTTINVTLHWWLDYSVVQSQCEEPTMSAIELTNLANSLDTAYQDYIDLGPLNNVSTFESASENLKISDYPTWNHNTLLVQIEPSDGMPLDGFVYVGRETLKISGYSVTIPLSKRSFLPSTFQISFSTKRSFSVKWWANYFNAQNIPIQMSSSSNQNQDSVYCEYNFVGGQTGKLKLKYSINDFADGNPPVYTAKSTLEGPSLGMAANSFHIGTVYNIQANISDGKMITLAIPIDVGYHVDKEDVFVYHERNGVVERIVPDSVVNGFVYFQTNSCSDFWTSVTNFIKDVGGAVVDGIATVVEVIVEGVQYVVDSMHDFYDWLTDNVCSLFDLETWENLFTKDSEERYIYEWDLLEGRLPNKKFREYNPPLFDVISISATSPLQQITDGMSDVTRLDVSIRNLDIMLSELIYRKMNTVGKKRFGASNLVNFVDDSTSEHVTKYLAVSTTLTKYAADMVRMLNDCYDAINLNILTNFLNQNVALLSAVTSAEERCKNLFSGFGFIDYIVDVFDCSADLLKLMAQSTQEDGKPILDFKNHRDELILKTSAVLARVSLLAYYDKSMREPLRIWFNQSYKSLSAMMELLGPLMLYNNISIKAEAAMALYEYVYWGGTSHFEKFKKGIELHYGENGGYSEGTGYLQYINEDVPYLMVSLRKAFIQGGTDFDLPEKFYNSGYFLKNMARNVSVGLQSALKLRIPVEMDDGGTYTPEYSVWGTLTGDAQFFRLAKKYPIDIQYNYQTYVNELYTSQGLPMPPEEETLNNYLNFFLNNSKNTYGNPLAGSPLIALGYGGWNDKYSMELEEENGVTGRYADGTAVVNYRDENGDDFTISVVAENGKLWENGQAHDQQDNMSFTLTSTRDGHIVRDMGYSGFGLNVNTHGYQDHNVLMRPNHPELTDGKGNRSLSHSDLANIVEKYTLDFTGIATYGLFGIFSNELADYGVSGAGGSQAYLVDSLRSGDLLAYTFHQRTNGGVWIDLFTLDSEQVEPFENYRSIAYFGKAIWLFDQPSDKDLLWVVNGSTQAGQIQGTYFDDKVDTYVGGHMVGGYNTCSNIGASQNISRADILLRTIWVCRQIIDLSEYCLEQHAQPITMVYPIDLDNSFRWTPPCNAPDIQCFERTEGNVTQRVIVPAKDASYKVNEVLADVPPSNMSTYSGIMFAEREENGDWYVHGVLNEGAKVNKLIIKTQYLPSNLLLRNF